MSAKPKTSFSIWLKPLLVVARRSGSVALAARVGYASRGAVYLSIGAIALLKALRLTPHAEGAIGALRAWGQWPIGVVLLWIAGVGLCGFAGWRALQSIFDIEDLGNGPKAMFSRAGKAISGLLYGTMGVTVLNLLDTLRDLRKGEDQAIAVASVQAALNLPFGSAIVVLGGGILFLAGIGNIARAFVDHFTEVLECDPRWNGLVGSLARVGYFARGAAFLPAGLFTVLAGWHARADEAVSVGTSLDLFLRLPFGRTLLVLQALGLASFGIFGLVKAVFRRVATS